SGRRLVVGVVVDGHAPSPQRGLDAPDTIAGLADAVLDAGWGVGAAELGLLLEVDRKRAAVGIEQLALLVDLLRRDVGGGLSTGCGRRGAEIRLDRAEVDADGAAVECAAHVCLALNLRATRPGKLGRPLRA